MLRRGIDVMHERGHVMPMGDHAAPMADHDTHPDGHDRHAGHSLEKFRDRFWLSLALTVPVVLLSAEVAGWFGYTIPAIPAIGYVPAVLGTVIFFYGGLVFIRS